MLWIKAFHIIAVVLWFAGLFYLPRLFVYHAETASFEMKERFSLMERKLYYFFMTPSAVLTLLLGGCLLHYTWDTFSYALWLHIKLGLVGLLLVFHVYLGCLLKTFAHHQNRYGGTFYRWINEVPTLFLIAIVILVVVKP